MPRYEYNDGVVHKFWEINLEGATMVRRWGVIGGDAEGSRKPFPSEAAAQKEYAKLIREKVSKGYLLVAGDPRVGPPAPAPPPAKLARNEQLEGAIAEAPDDVQRYRVYGDWLQSQGDPRGELVALQCETAEGPRRAESKSRVREILVEHPAHFLGPFAKYRSAAEVRSWRYGFFESVRFDVPYGFKGPPAHELLAELLAHPSARFLRSLTIGFMAGDGSLDYGPAIAALRAAPGLEALEHLYLGDFSREETELSWSHASDVGSLVPKLPRLRSLRVRCGSFRLSRVDFPALRELRIETGGLKGEVARTIDRTPLPHLETLALWLGTSRYGGDCAVTDFATILEGTNLPKLKHLALANSEIADEIAGAVAKARIVARLETLDLSKGTMTDAGAAALAASRALAKLATVNVSDNALSNDGITRMQLAGIKVYAGYQKGQDDRYVSVGE